MGLEVSPLPIIYIIAQKSVSCHARVQVLPDDLVRLPDGSVGTASLSTLQHSFDDVLLPLVGTKTLMPTYAAVLFASENPPDAALAALASPPVGCDAMVSSATKKAIAQPGS
jgi:hypothetical protein